MKTALLVPCFNAVRFLPLLQSQVAAMSPVFDQVLLADDGSADDTLAMARAMGFDIIPLGSNRGPGGARNALAKATDADWIHFHDVDDEITPDYLSHMHGLDALDLILHQVDFISEASRRREVLWSYDMMPYTPPVVRLLTHPMPTMASLIRRSMFLSVGGFDESRRCFEDGDLHFRLALAKARVSVVHQILERSLRNGSGASANLGYCFKCRLSFLKEYTRKVPADLLPLIAKEAERTADSLLSYQHLPEAREALQLARSLGLDAPISANPVIRTLRKISPFNALRLQNAVRSSYGNMTL